MSKRIDIYDTTLRDGTQGEGFNLSLQDKVLIAIKLDELGVDFIEGGFPLSNPKDAAFFQEIKLVRLKHAKISAFGMTRRRGMKAGDDPGILALLAADTPAVTIVGKTSDYHAKMVLGVSLDENVSMIEDTVAHMRESGRQVIYDAEHFFDTFRSNRDYALRTLTAAEKAGASVLCLCDTNGGTMPEQIAEAVVAVKAHCSAQIGIHTHNDSGLALANGIAGVRAGATQAQGTINGVGERCGNMDLIPCIANLRLKYNIDCLQPGTLERLTETSRYVYEIANMNIATGQPYVGPSAFAHKGGMHVHAVQKDSSTYEHISPEQVGNSRKVLISEMSGVSNIASTLGKKFEIDKNAQRVVLEQVQNLENKGFQFEAAEASFELLLRKQIGKYQQFFSLDHYGIEVRKVGGGSASSQAMIKMNVGPAVELCVAEGDGPVAAIDAALRKGLRPHYPVIDQLHLTDYKVRVINSKDETSADVRVIIEWRRGKHGDSGEVFGTIGVSANVIDASWQALCDAYDYHLIHVQEAR